MGVIKVSKPLNKKQVKIKNKALEAISKANQFGIPLETISFKADLDASNAIQAINSDIEALSANDVFSSFTGNTWTIPSQMTFYYWIQINLWGEMWANKFKLTCEDNELKDITRKLIKNACIFGQSCFESKEFYGVVAVKKTSPWTGIIDTLAIQPLPANANELVASSEGVAFKGSDDKSRVHEIKDLSSVALLSWRDNGIGDYVYCMHDICLDIYKKQVIDSNSKNLIQMPEVKVGDLDNFKTENIFNNNPFNSCKVTIIDSQGGNVNKWEIPENKNSQWLAELHTDLRFHQEYYYNLFGMDVASAKGQSLSADVNLSNTRAQCIQMEKYNRVDNFVKKISKLTGIKITLEEPEQQELEPNNNNAMKDNPTTKSDVENKTESK